MENTQFEEKNFTDKLNDLKLNSLSENGRKILREMTCLKNTTQLFR